MIWSVPAAKDTTIYEIDPYRNTGLDQILELRKEGDISTSDLTESRILINFDLTDLPTILAENGISINDISASLKMYAVQEFETPQTYTIQAKALAVDWANGTGYLPFPGGTIISTSTTDGATWLSTAGTGSATWSSSLSPSTAMLYNNQQTPGGGLWHTSSIVSQSFNFKSTDSADINVTKIVKDWVNGVYTNNGFLVSFNNSEISSSNYPNTNLQFYSSDTHTVYEPQLYISWTGSIQYTTGSTSILTYEDNPIVYIRNFKGELVKNKKTRVLIGSRPKYPRASFSQNTTFSDIKLLPSSSYYQIKDAHNEKVIIPYSEATKISTNASGSYFDLYTTMFYGERYYKFEIKSTFNGLTEYFTSNEFIFKIVE